ncbi:MAG: tyrosine-type recombinase/integrase [Firmicutes bacterium]|nr:tyrosine-type recombinase/integrase [Bacillota bacterium]
MLNLKKELEAYLKHLQEEEKSKNTIEKYERDIRKFLTFAEASGKLDKQTVIGYKESITAQYAVASVNSMLVAVNCFLKYAGKADCCVRLLKSQRQSCVSEERQLTREEFHRLIKAAATRQDQRIMLVMETICATGIRVSELQFITAEAVKAGVAQVAMKGKCRSVFLPGRLRQKLKEYIRKKRISSGAVFCTAGGRPLNRSNIWAQMKKLCRAAGVAATKVFPHNLRHLFARTFYQAERDIVALADILGHSSVETTRIYTKITAGEQARKIEQLRLIT